MAATAISQCDPRTKDKPPAPIQSLLQRVLKEKHMTLNFESLSLYVEQALLIAVFYKELRTH